MFYLAVYVCTLEIIFTPLIIHQHQHCNKTNTYVIHTSYQFITLILFKKLDEIKYIAKVLIILCITHLCEPEEYILKPQYQLPSQWSSYFHQKNHHHLWSSKTISKLNSILAKLSPLRQIKVSSCDISYSEEVTVSK